MSLKGLRRHANADIATKTEASFPEHLSVSGLCSICILCGKCEIGRKAKEGRALFPEPFGIAQFAAEKRVPNLQDLQIVPELFGKEVIFRQVDTKGKVGSFECTLPLICSAMGSTKVAHERGKELARGCAKAGIPHVIGENVFPTYGKEGLKERMKAFLDDYTGLGALVVQANVEDRKLKVPELAVELGAHAIELKLGQGAKQGLGGEIKFKEKEMVERFRKLGYLVLEGKDWYERHSHPGSLSEEELEEMLEKYSELDVPIWLKIGMGQGIFKLLALLQKLRKRTRFECITIDGHGGGTGMSPWLIMNEVGVPSALALSKLKVRNYTIALAGGFKDGADMAKALMLGADAVAMARAFLIAAQLGKAEGICNFVNALKEELQMICATQRVEKVYELKNKRKNLMPLSNEAEKLFGLSFKLG